MLKSPTKYHLNSCKWEFSVGEVIVWGGGGTVLLHKTTKIWYDFVFMTYVWPFRMFSYDYGETSISSRMSMEKLLMWILFTEKIQVTSFAFKFKVFTFNLMLERFNI